MKIVIKEAKKDLMKDPLSDRINVGTSKENYTFSLRKLVNYLPQHYKEQELDPNIFVKQVADVKEDPLQKDARIENANLKFPIAVIKHKDGNFTIIDGTHRIRKAIKYNLKVKAFIIPFEDLKIIKSQLTRRVK